LINLTRIRGIIKKRFDLKEISTKLSTDFVDKINASNWLHLAYLGLLTQNIDKTLLGNGVPDFFVLFFYVDSNFIYPTNPNGGVRSNEAF